ncbi:MAG: hypothetical protein WBM32_17290 [Crocosphaera sp.]
MAPPPEKILEGQQGKFWLQDYPGLIGTEGSVTYTITHKAQDPAQDKTLTFSYTCPTAILSNDCSGSEFITSNNGVDWSGRNQIKTKGHPFFVKFILE